MKRITKERPNGTRLSTPPVRRRGEIHHGQTSVARLAGCSRQYVSAVVHSPKSHLDPARTHFQCPGQLARAVPPCRTDRTYTLPRPLEQGLTRTIPASQSTAQPLRKADTGAWGGRAADASHPLLRLPACRPRPRGAREMISCLKCGVPTLVTETRGTGRTQKCSYSVCAPPRPANRHHHAPSGAGVRGPVRGDLGSLGEARTCNFGGRHVTTNSASWGRLRG